VDAVRLADFDVGQPRSCREVSNSARTHPAWRSRMRGPSITFSPVSKSAVDEVLVKFQARWVLREDGELEVGGAVATR